MGRRRTYRTRAIVLGKTKLGETDLILTLLAQDGRQIRAVGKGARKPGSRLAARCELCCDVDALLACGRALDVIAEARLVAAPLGAAPSVEALSAASAVAQVARFSCFEDAEDPFIFPITRRALDVVASVRARSVGARTDLVVAAYVFKLLSHMGYRPDLSSCVLCGDADPTRFSASAGGLLCSSCAASVSSAVRLDAGLVRCLRELMSSRLDELACAVPDARRAMAALACAHAWAATHLDVRLRSLEFMLGR